MIADDHTTDNGAADDELARTVLGIDTEPPEDLAEQLAAAKATEAARRHRERAAGIEALAAGMAGPVGEAWLSSSPPPPPPSVLWYRDGSGGALWAAGPFGGTAGVLGGAGAVGKSRLVLDLALAVAGSGWTAADDEMGEHTEEAGWWCGRFLPDGGRVLIVSAEDEEAEVRRRLRRAAAKLTEAARARAARRLHVADLSSAAPELLSVTSVTRAATAEERARAVALISSVRAVEVHTSLLAEELRARLVAAREDKQPFKLVVLDPLARLGGAEAETDNAVAARLMRELAGIAAEASTAVVVVHHTTKRARAAGDAGAEALRGSSALVDGSRWVATLTAVEAGDIEAFKLAVPKCSYARRPPPVWLRDTAEGFRRETATERKEREAAAKAANTRPRGRSRPKKTKGPGIGEP